MKYTKKKQKLSKKGLQYIDSFEGYLYKKHPVTYEKYLDFRNRRDYHKSKILKHPKSISDIFYFIYLSQMGFNFDEYIEKMKYSHNGFDRDSINDVCDVVWAMNEFHKLPNQSRLNFFDECEEFIVEQIEKNL